MNMINDVKATVKEVASKKSISQVVAYSLAFVIALCAVGLAITFRDEKTDRFGVFSYLTAIISPALIKVLFRWLQGKGVGGSFLTGGLNYQLGAAVGVAIILMYSFDTVLKPMLRAEAAAAGAGKDGLLSTIMFGIPSLINKEKAAAAKSYVLSGAISHTEESKVDQVADKSPGAGSGSTPGSTSAGGSGGVADDLQKLIDDAFGDVQEPSASAGVGGVTDDLFLDMVR